MDDKNLEALNNELMTLIRHSSLDKKHGGLDRSTYTLLYHLARHEKVGVKLLAEEFGLDASTISRQTSVLETKGYAIRVPDPQDGRSSYFQITELGASKLEEARSIRLKRYGEIFEDWSPEDCHTFSGLLARLNRKQAQRSAQAKGLTEADEAGR
ncbi:MarR family winged helix-turn-helix transcriptional regulator [Paenibacillus sp. HW567]|uniref:MarR family winged helix-turn-helix transcriptional regulator n=1 Tax=Paenibacillus sp. HW567 TaxID=1034769 RepID=UPI00036E23BC|nr:MarR family transcriptional regulator [Paenibacillus sp. HW567]